MTLAEDVFLNRAKLVMKFLGVWVQPENESWPRKIYRNFMLMLQYLFLIFQIIYIIQVWGDLDAVSQAFYVIFTQACLCFKVTVFQLNMKMLKELIERMNSDIFKTQCIEHETVLKLQAARIKKFLLAFMIASQITCGLWALKPFFDDKGHRKFPFDMWMPVKPEGTPQYLLGYFFQLATISFSAQMYFGVDSVPFSCIIFSCAQIDIIKVKLFSIKPVWKKRGNDLKEVMLDNYKTLVECHNQYQAIATFTELVENTYHTYIFFQVTGCVGLFCMSAFRMLVVDWYSVQFASILCYVHVMLIQLYMCCWCGHELTATNEELHSVLYQCLWYEQDVKFQRELCFAMMRVSRPMFLRAGHFIILSRETFVTILRMSYSYFAVLNQTNKN